jgi:hypothetical protein
VFKRDDFERFALNWRLVVQSGFERLGEVTHGGLLLGALLLFGIMGFSWQGRELFRLMLERLDWFEIACAILAAVLLSGLLFFTYRSFLPNLASDTEHDSAVLRLVANLGLYGIAASPWLSGFASLWWMKSDLAQARNRLQEMVDDAGVRQISEQGSKVIRAMRELEALALPALLIMAALCALTLGLLWAVNRRTARRLRYAVVVILRVLAIFIIVVLGFGAVLFNWQFVAFYQWIGTLAVGLITTISLFAIALTLSWTARVTGVTIYFALLSVLGLYWAGVTLGDWIGTRKPTAALQRDPVPLFNSVVGQWVEDRSKAGPSPNPAPMIVVSAQGGGMYAAIASSLFMARLEDSAPGFHASVLAVSAVSGGAIGSVLYETLASPGGCQRNVGIATDATDAGAPGGIEGEIARILLRPHFAPVVGNITADVIRKLPPFVFLDLADRSDAFTQSLVDSCPALARSSIADWTVSSKRPALVLNTTWMRNGHRVAIAPFKLFAIGDGTLWSFDDVYESLGSLPYRRGSVFRPTLADAAVASARFPGVLPPLSLTSDQTRHNYGDGGYADGSGVSTALEMYRAAVRIAAASPDVAPLLVMITFNYSPVRPNDADTAFVETGAPLEAILGVRNNLSDQAITRAENFGGEDTEARYKVLRVSINPDDLGLAIGLQLSRTSYSVVSLLLGRPEWCDERTSNNRANAILRNSCVAAKIVRLVGRHSSRS